MVYAPVRPIIPSLKLRVYLSVQAHKPCCISHSDSLQTTSDNLNHIILSDAENIIFIHKIH